MSVIEGFAPGQRTYASILGVNETTMNTRSPREVFDAAYQRWRYGSSAQIPNWGSLYTESGSTIIVNTSTPQTLPANASEGIFLAPQAEGPVVGSAWGLLVKYSCTGISRMSDFVILKRRINSTNPDYVTNYTAIPAELEFLNFGSDTNSLYYATELGNANFYYELGVWLTPWGYPSINTLSQSPTYGGGGNSLSVIAFAEIGLLRTIKDLSDLSPGAGVGYSSYQWPDGHRERYNGLEEVDILEILLWQGVDDIDVISEVDDPIPGLEREHTFRGEGLSAIGIQCRSSSATGTANINGLTGTFSNFSRVDSEASILADIPRFGIGMPAMLLPGNRSQAIYDIYDFLSFTTLPSSGSQDYHLMGTDLQWIEPLFTAAGMPTKLNSTGFITYSRVMQRADLQRAVEEAYKHYALQLMFYGQENAANEWSSPTLYSAVKWPILIEGDGVPPLVVLVLFSLWAFGCVALGLAYGIRRRYSATFDMPAFYQFCGRKENHFDPKQILGIS